MTFAQILRLPLSFVRSHRLIVIVTVLAILAASFYPSDLDGTYGESRGGQDMVLVTGTEHAGRFVNTALQLGVPLLLRDVTGLKQLAVITVAGIVASHGPKRLLNDVHVMGTRLGQRPWSPDSAHNTPSGHATLAGSAVAFLMRRYGWIWGLITIPILLLTMYARVMLDAHTVSAVIAGALTGILVSAMFTSRWPGRKTPTDPS